jgi:hypothetical protein
MRQKGDHPKGGICLQGEMHAPASRAYRTRKPAVVITDTIARIDIEGRSILRGDIGKRYTADRQNSVRISDESRHGYGTRSQSSAGLAGISDGR